MAIKKFEISEGTTERLTYLIEVRFRGEVIERFERPTMREAVNAFEFAGYVEIEEVL